MKTTVRVEGLREVEAALEELKPAAARAQTRNALRAGGELLAKAARARVPVDQGHLRESITVSGTLTRRQRSLHRKQSDQEQFVGPGGHPQAHMQEYGTTHHRPQPYMRPAFDEEKENVLKRITDQLMVSVQRAIERARRRGMSKG